MRRFYGTALFKYGFLIMLYVAVFGMAAVLFGSDFSRFFGWCWTLVAAGIIFFPVSFLIFGRFRDCGILFSMILGTGFMSWLSWFLSSVGFIPFNGWGCVMILLICAGCNIGFILAVRKIKGSFIPDDYDFKSKIVPMLITGLVFLVSFTVWTYIRGFKPEALGSTESVMDYAFMKSMDKANYMPATDMWMSGMSFNYYYVGQFIATFLSKLSGVGVGYGYNLMLMTEAALAFSVPYSLIMTVFSEYLDLKRIKRKVSSYGAGILSGIAVCLCGNFHYLVFYYVVPILRDILGLSELQKNNPDIALPQYFFPNSTRYIGYMPTTNDKTIHEFPSYSFVLGDLHAHVINIMFVLCVAGILYAYILNHREMMRLAAVGRVMKADKNAEHTLFGIEHFFKKVFDPCVIATAFFIGLFHMTNYWDYPIYFVVSGAVILYVNFVSEGARLSGVILTAFHAAIVVIISKLVCLPFTLSFDQISSEIMAVTDRTPLYQFIILWGFPFLVAIVFIVTLIKSFRNSGTFTGSFGESTAKRAAQVSPEEGTAKRAAKVSPEEGTAKRSAPVRFLLQTSHSDIFILILVLCAMGLCLIPEVVYVKDIYSGDYKRANTMFKITYQAFILFGMSMGYIIAGLLLFGKKKLRVFGVVCLCLLLLSAGYVKVASDSWFFSGEKTFTGLSSDEFLETSDNDEYEAIVFLNENTEGRPVIIEANGDSYSTDCRFSAWTGLPTVLGWKTHEWLWRSSGNEGYPAVLSERENDIRSFYTAHDTETMRKVIDKYDISYIIIGQTEKNKYGENLSTDLLLMLGDTVFGNDTVRIVKVDR
ncbi:MAG: hypothetical protein K6E95_05880 [Lachnospiraceae bacterium]|nr:hypothetical protein [Lachnospiraceae bacterium]